MRASGGRPGRPLRAVPAAPLVAGALLAAALAGCAPYRPPEGWLEAPAPSQKDVYGAWIRLRFPEDEPDVDGELLAAGDDSVWVLRRDGRVEAVALAGIEKAELYAYDPDLTGGNVWATLGILGTASNGYYSSFTMPLWSLAAGIGLGSDRRAAAPSARERGEWEKVRKYARFPQGLPPGLPRTLPTRIPLQGKGRG